MEMFVVGRLWQKMTFLYPMILFAYFILFVISFIKKGNVECSDGIFVYIFNSSRHVI